MRLFELSGAKRVLSSQNLPRYMMNHGFSMVGAGIYGSVYKSDAHGYVIKLFSRADRGYQAFLRFAQSHGSPHLPVFRGKFKTVTNKYMACRMEPLAELKRIGGVGHRFNIFTSLMKDWHQPFTREQFVKFFQTDPQVTDEFIDLLVQLDAVRLSAEVSWDLHSGNVMLRGNTLVLVDPFV